LRGKHNSLAPPQLRGAGGRRCELRCTLFLAMTAKEKLLQRAPHWSEEQAERALRAAESDGAVDESSDLSKLHEVSSAETMRRLAEAEQAAGHEPW
jgi:hypothetical protein